MNNINHFAENLKFLRSKTGKTQAEIGVTIGFKRNTWSNYENNASKPNFEDLLAIAKYFNISLSELVQVNLANAQVIKPGGGDKNLQNVQVIVQEYAKGIGQNEGLQSQLVSEPSAQYKRSKAAFLPPKVVTVDAQGRDNVVLVPVKARAGYLLGYGDAKYVQKLPSFSLPGLRNGSFRAFEVEGHSMHNTLYDRDIVIGSYVELAQHVRDERVYIFVTKEEGILIKRAINRVEEAGVFILKSDNIYDRNAYPNIVLQIDQINEIWYCEIVISHNLRSPADIFNRLTELEARLTLLEYSKKHSK